MQRAEAPATNCDIERSLANLVIKASEAEDTLDQLNDVIVRQPGQID